MEYRIAEQQNTNSTLSNILILLCREYTDMETIVINVNILAKRNLPKLTMNVMNLDSWCLGHY